MSAANTAPTANPRRWVAEQLRDNRYVVRPENCLGTCGWQGGRGWTAQWVTGRTRAEALAQRLTKENA